MASTATNGSQPDPDVHQLTQAASNASQSLEKPPHTKHGPNVATDVTHGPHVASDVTYGPQVASDVTYGPHVAFDVTYSPQVDLAESHWWQ